MKNEEIYMLRCWKDNTNSSWRFGIKNIKSGKSKFFRSLQDLKKYLDGFEDKQNIFKESSNKSNKKI